MTKSNGNPLQYRDLFSVRVLALARSNWLGREDSNRSETDDRTRPRHAASRGVRVAVERIPQTIPRRSIRRAATRRLDFVSARAKQRRSGRSISQRQANRASKDKPRHRRGSTSRRARGFRSDFAALSVIMFYGTCRAARENHPPTTY
jgi:hypothetical protein